MKRVPKSECKYCSGKDTEDLCASHQTRYTHGLRGKALAAPLRGYGEHDPHDDQPIVDQVQFLRKANRALEYRLTEYQNMLAERHELLENIKAAVVASNPLPKTHWKEPKAGTVGSLIVPVIKFSDWHIGARINADETEGFGEYDWEIAQRRAHGIVSSFLKWIDTLRHGYKIHECVVFGEGDYISGDIHDELRVTNEFPIPVQTAKAGLLFSDLVSRLSGHFEHVTVYQVGADNHGRLTAKPQYKQKFQNSMSFLVNAVAEAHLAKHANVNIVVSQGMKYVADVLGWKFLIEHGDTVKSWMGIPYYGIERSRAREAVKRMNTDKTFHYMSCGHWHVPTGWLSGNIFVNGSLSGTDEYDHGAGRSAEPAQAAFLVHPTHGIFNFTPFRAT